MSISLSNTERTVVEYVAKGESCNLRNKTISSRLIKLLCIDPDSIAPASGLPDFRVLPYGIEIHNATIKGDIDLRSAKLEFGLRFRGCTFEGQVILEGTRLRHLEMKECTLKKGLNIENALVWENVDISGATLKSVNDNPYREEVAHHSSDHQNSVLWARDAEIKGSLIAQKCKVQGEIFLAGAQIDGMLDLSGTDFGRQRKSFTGQWAIFALNAEIGGSVYLRGVKVHTSNNRANKQKPPQGAICFYGASLKSKLSASFESEHATFSSLDFSEATIDGDVEIKECEIKHCLMLRGCDVNGSITLEGTKFSGKNKDGYSVIGRDLRVAETLQFGREPSNSRSDSEDAQRREATSNSGNAPQTGKSSATEKSSSNNSDKITVSGSIDLTGAHIGRNLLLDHLNIKGKAGNRNRSIRASSIQVGGALMMRYTTVAGAVDLRVAQIQKIVSLHGVEINHAEGGFPSLTMRGAYVGLDLVFGDEDYKGCCGDNCFSANWIRLSGIQVNGSLRLYRGCVQGIFESVGIQVGGDFKIEDTKFIENVDLSGSRVAGSFECRSSEFARDSGPVSSKLVLRKGIKMYNSSIGQDVRFTDVILGKKTKPQGKVELIGAKIGGALAVTGKCHLPFEAHNMSVGQDVFLRGEGAGFVAHQTVRLDGSEIGGNLDCRGGKFVAKPSQDSSMRRMHEFKSPTDYCLYAAGISVGQSVYLGVLKSSSKTETFTATGAVCFSDAKIGRNFDCRGGVFNDSSERCFYAPRIVVGGDMNFCVVREDNKKRFTAHGTVRIPGAQIGGG
jgi:hypothetical protein